MCATVRPARLRVVGTAIGGDGWRTAGPQAARDGALGNNVSQGAHVEANHGRVVENSRMVRLDETHAAHVRLFNVRVATQGWVAWISVRAFDVCAPLPVCMAQGERTHREVEAPVHSLAGLLACIWEAQVEVQELITESALLHVLILLPIDCPHIVALLFEPLRKVRCNETSSAGHADLQTRVVLGELHLGDGRQHHVHLFGPRGLLRAGELAELAQICR
eukprot:scaffold965_cov120-Isochrysis_galbana.AAC.14